MTRKTYSIAGDRASELARHTFDIDAQVEGRTVARQDVLDALVGCLADPAVLKKVIRIIKDKIKAKK